MLALIALYIMRPPFLGTIAEDPTDAASAALRLDLECRAECGPVADVVRPHLMTVVSPPGCLDVEAIEPALAAR